MCVSVGGGDGFFPKHFPLEHEAEQQEADTGSRWGLFIVRFHRAKESEQRGSAAPLLSPGKKQNRKSDASGQSLSCLHPRLTLFFDALKLQKRKEKKRKRKTLNSLLLLASLRERRSLSGIAIAELRAQAARERERETELKRQARYVWKLKRGRTPLSPSNAPLSTSSWKEERAAPLPVAARASLISLSTSAHSTLPRKAIANARPGTSPVSRSGKRIASLFLPLLLPLLSLSLGKKKLSSPLSSL